LNIFKCFTNVRAFTGLAVLWFQHSQMKPRFHHLLLLQCDWEICDVLSLTKFLINTEENHNSLQMANHFTVHRTFVWPSSNVLHYCLIRTSFAHYILAANQTHIIQRCSSSAFMFLAWRKQVRVQIS
jgi:hypothetical protein